MNDNSIFDTDSMDAAIMDELAKTGLIPNGTGVSPIDAAAAAVRASQAASEASVVAELDRRGIDA